MTYGFDFMLILLALLLVFCLIVFVWDVTQKKHTVLRNFPVFGHFRYIGEWLGEYIRPYFIAQDREERPFHRAERSWVYRAAKGEENVVSFGSTRDFSRINSIFFVDAPFPVLERDVSKTRPVVIGPHCRDPYTANSFFNASGMSYGALSKRAVLAISKGVKKAGCWMNTGEGGISPYHLEGGADIVAQIGSAKFGFRTETGELCDDRLKKAAALPQVKMFEIKLSQGAKPGKGGLLPGVKVTPEISKIRGVPVHKDCYSPNRHPEISNVSELLDFVHHVREVTGKPVGFKVVIGGFEWIEELCQEIKKRGVESAPDFITLDGGEGGTGAAPKPLMDFMGLSIQETLPVIVDLMKKHQLRERIKIVASGKLITPSRVAWALCVGADFIVSARGMLFSLGCIQALRCHTNNCPTGITSHKPRFMRGLDVATKSERVKFYIQSLVHEVEMISHSCGVKEPRDLTRHHARIVTEKGTTISLDELCRSQSD